jgi:hypothetical protein
MLPILEHHCQRGDLGKWPQGSPGTKSRSPGWLPGPDPSFPLQTAEMPSASIMTGLPELDTTILSVPVRTEEKLTALR